MSTTWQHCGQEIERGKACPGCRRKLVRLWDRGGELSILQHDQAPAEGNVFDVLAEPPAFRPSAEETYRLSQQKANPELDPGMAGRVLQAQGRVQEVTRG